MKIKKIKFDFIYYKMINLWNESSVGCYPTTSLIEHTQMVVCQMAIAVCFERELNMMSRELSTSWEICFAISKQLCGNFCISKAKFTNKQINNENVVCSVICYVHFVFLCLEYTSVVSCHCHEGCVCNPQTTFVGEFVCHSIYK